MSEFIRVDDKGNLAPEDTASRSRLAGQAGRFYLAPTSPDILFAVRAPCRGGGAAPRVVLAGDLSGLALADLVAFLNQGRMSGLLRVLSTSGERAIVFKDGEVRGAASDNPTDRLGEIAVRLGCITRPQLEQVLAHPPPNTRIGRALVDAGFLKSHDLWKCMQHQVTEIFHSILLASEGAFMLVDQPVDDRNSMTLNTQGLLMDAIRRIDEMKEFRKRLPSPRTYMLRKKAAGADLDQQERALYSLCDGQRTVADLAQLAHLSEFDATKVLHHLVEGGFLTPSPTPGANAPQTARPAEHLTPERVTRVFNDIFKEILMEMRQKGAAAEFIGAANAAAAGQAAKVPMLRGASFAPDGTLPEAQLAKGVAALGLAPAEGAKVLQSVLNELMFFLLFQAGELLEEQENEELGHRVKQLLAALEGEA